MIRAQGNPEVLGVKNTLPANADVREHEFDPWVGKTPWRICANSETFNLKSSVDHLCGSLNSLDLDASVIYVI